jgi:aminopeptidase N
MQQPTPKNYEIHLIPDLINFTFSGSVTLLAETESAIEELRLNILDLAITSCGLRAGDQFIDCAFEANNEKEELKILFPQKMQGTICIRVHYEGQINDKMAGFYRSRYVSHAKTKHIAVTQFEESDARRAFPCMDHPAKKATFDIIMDIDPDLVAISNGVIASESPLASGKKRIVFEQTPKMSTYLVFIGVGEFEFTRDTEDPRLRVVTLPGMKPYARFGLEFGRMALAFSETYYGIPYPLTKMDLIAIPDFAFGAMENWGAITFRENLLLHYPQITSKSGEERIREVIAHEIAHQWFGNLVTPSDWKYLWLNESFATYFGYGVVDHYYPHLDSWQQFIYGQTGSAMARDALQENFAIEIPGGEHVVINVGTAPIIYSKGASILRQIEGYIGRENFQKGLQAYLKTYAYTNTTSHHLWDCFEKVSNQPVGEMMQSWIEQPGFPLISVKKKGNRLELTQRRFTCLPNDSDQTWRVPVTVAFFSSKTPTERLTILMDETKHEIEIPAHTQGYKLNDRQTGFYIVDYRDAENLDALGRLVRNRSLTPEDRWGLQNDLFALCRSGKVTITDYLKFLVFYENEDAFLPLISISNNLQHAALVLPASVKEKISAVVRPWLEKVLENIGYQPAPDEKHTTAQLREQLIWHASLCGSQKTTEFVRRKFAAMMQGRAAHPDLMKSVMQVGAFIGNEQAFEWLERRFQSSGIEHERMNILMALGCFKEKELIQKSQQFILDEVPARNKFVPVIAMAANPYAIPLLWNWYVSSLKQIEKFHPMLYERVIAAIVPMAGIERPQEVRAFFEDYMQKTDKASDVIKLSLERLEINLRLRAAN